MDFQSIALPTELWYPFGAAKIEKSQVAASAVRMFSSFCNVVGPASTFALMHLVIDIGNTQTKALVFGAGGVQDGLMVAPTGPQALRDILDRHSEMPTAIATVVELEEAISSLLRERGVLVVDGDTPLPITSRYRTPRTLGVDRICAAVGAHAQFPGRAVLAIDLGTCITCDLVSAEGEYLGGSISPGLRMRYRALHEFTSRLPLLEPESDEPLTGTDTEASMRSGVQRGIRSELDAVIDSHLRQYPDLAVVGTGGDLAFFAGVLKRPIFADPLLVLRGLHEILLHNL